MQDPTLEPSDDELAAIETQNSVIDLDDLWTDVLLNAKTKALPKHPLALPSTKTLYTNPDNWHRSRGIAIIHKPTETLLGNFSEYIHTKIKECRKLIREESPICVEAVEEVTGNWWLGVERKPEPTQVWHERRPAMLHVYLPELHVHAPAVCVTACLSYGAIARVELVEATRFAQWDDQGKQGEMLIDLPAGTNILEVMSMQSKIKLREELGI